MNPRDTVFFQDPLMGGHGQGSLSLFELLEHARIDEVGDDQVRLRALQAFFSDDSLHAADACLLGMSGILVVIDRELDEEQIDGTMGKDASLQTKGSRGRAGGGYASIDKLELGLGKSFLEPFCHHRSISVHLGDGTSHEGYAGVLFFSKTARELEKEQRAVRFSDSKAERAEGDENAIRVARAKLIFMKDDYLEKASMASPVIFAKSLFSIEFTGVSQDPPTVRTASS